MVDPWASNHIRVDAGWSWADGAATAVAAALTVVVGVVIARRLWHPRARSEGCQQLRELVYCGLRRSDGRLRAGGHRTSARSTAQRAAPVCVRLGPRVGAAFLSVSPTPK